MKLATIAILAIASLATGQGFQTADIPLGYAEIQTPYLGPFVIQKDGKIEIQHTPESVELKDGLLIVQFSEHEGMGGIYVTIPPRPKRVWRDVYGCESNKVVKLRTETATVVPAQFIPERLEWK